MDRIIKEACTIQDHHKRQDDSTTDDDHIVAANLLGITEFLQIFGGTDIGESQIARLYYRASSKGGMRCAEAIQDRLCAEIGVLAAICNSLITQQLEQTDWSEIESKYQKSKDPRRLEARY